MAKAKAVVKRRKAVTNIKKITRTMQLIATAKFQKTFKRATASKPYTDKITELVEQLSRQLGDLRHPLLHTNRRTGRSHLLVITSNRGLCGGFNAKILQLAIEKIRAVDERGEHLDVDLSGKKGISYFRFFGRGLNKTYTHFEDRVRFEEVEPLANDFMDLYTHQKVDSVDVIYTRFVSTGKQIPTVIRLLPMQATPGDAAQPAAEAPAQYDFSPEPRELLNELLPATVRTRLFQCFIDHAVSEQIARMVAMKAATDAATDMIKILTRTYNRARQTQITMELLDIMGGAEGLSK